MASILQEMSCLHWRSINTLHVPQQADGQDVLHFPSADVGEGVTPAVTVDENDCVLSWAFSRAEPSELQLTETHVDGQRSSSKRKVSFSTTVFPQACFHNRHGLVVLSADGALHRLVSRDQSSQDCLLDDFTSSSVDLRRELQRLGEPTVLGFITASKPADDSIFIGGQTGSILIVPADCFDTHSPAGCHELQHTPKGYRSYFSRKPTPAVTWASPLHPFAPDLLCALHADCSLWFWNTRTQQRVLVENLLQQSGQKDHMMPTAVGSVCSAQGHLRLVVHLEPKADTMCEAQTVAVSMDLRQSPDGQLQALNMRERMLEHSKLSLNTVMTHRSTADAESAQTWLLSDAPSLHAVTSSVSGKPHEVSCKATLIEKQGVDRGSGNQAFQVRFALSSHACTCKVIANNLCLPITPFAMHHPHLPSQPSGAAHVSRLSSSSCASTCYRVTSGIAYSNKTNTSASNCCRMIFGRAYNKVF